MIFRTVSCTLALVAITSLASGGLTSSSLARAQGGATPPAPLADSPDGADKPAEPPPVPPVPERPDAGPDGQPGGDSQTGEAQAQADGVDGQDASQGAGEDKADDKGKKDEKAKDERHGFGWAGLPLLNYNTDNGLGYGARLVLFDYGNNQKPYKYRLLMQFFQSTGGVAFHRVSIDAPRFRGSKWRIDGNIRLNRDRFAPYYGLGGQSQYDAEHETCADRAALEIDPDVCPGNPNFRGLRYYRYNLLMPGGVINIRRDLKKPWQLMASYQLEVVKAQTQYPDDLGQTTPSRLVEELNAGEPIVGLELDPDGVADWTRNGTLQVGLVYDTRDNEPAPTNGSWHEFSLRAASPILGGQFWYWGAHFRLRSYRALDAARRLVVAGRLLVDMMGGDAPIYRLSRTGGLISREVVGSGESLRGLPRARYIGKIKMIANAELRWRFLTVRPGGNRFDMTLVGGVDLGRAWRDFADNEKLLDGALTTAGGIRFGWNENFIVRFDYGYSPTDDITGFYLEFNHIF